MILAVLNFSTDDMVDVISTRLQEAYGTWRMPGFAANGDNIQEERFSATALRRFGDENRRRKTFNKEIERQVCIRSLQNIHLVLVPVTKDFFWNA